MTTSPATPGSLLDSIIAYLRPRDGQTASLTQLMQTFGPNVERFFDSTVVETFLVRPKEDWIKLEDRTWVRPVDSNARAAQNVALTATRIPDEWWTPLIEFAGAEKRKGAREGATDRSIVLARTYLEEQAALELEIEFDQLKPLLKSGKIACFMDPAGRLRVSATVIHGLVADRAQLEALLVPEEVSAGDLAEFFNLPLTVIGQRLGMNAKKPSVMVMWPLAQRRLWQPNKAPTLRDFRERLIARREEREADEKRRSERLQRKSEERAEKRRSEREQERLERERLRAQLLAAFPTWRHDRRDEQRLTLHVGPPNSGKTYHAIEALKTAGSGWYLAPLRLLAFEIYDRMNAMGVPCNLLTGEESIQREGALITAATVEMFSPHEKARCVVIDESHMLADAGRGWAWTRALMEATAPDIRVITSPSGRNLIERMAKSADLPFEVVEHQRLTPIAIADRPWTLEMIPSRTILVAFSRRSVLQLKTFLENLKRKVSVVYGNLPPEVRRRQADRFANGETEICIATDAVGMGLNLPADAVCFYEVEKFDGKEHRELNASEVHQIGGRAGRFGLSTAGLIGACDRFSLQVIQNLFNQPLPDLNFARVSPEVEDLALMPGTLSEKYVNWRELNGIPSEWRELLKPADIEERVALAGMLKDQEVERLGLESAVRLVNAPTTESTRLYWRHCADSIIYERPMPIPPNAPERIESGQDLQTTEFAIACADIYLWLSQRPEFEADAADAEAVREERYMWSMNIDEALTKKLDTRARCQSCGKPLPVGHRFAICDRCYHRRRGAY